MWYKTTLREMENDHQSEIEKNFKPKGTIAFIVLLLILAAMVWFSVYNLQIERH